MPYFAQTQKAIKAGATAMPFTLDHIQTEQAGLAVRISARVGHDPAAAKQSFSRLMQLTANLEPNSKNGATAAIRKLRDDS